MVICAAAVGIALAVAIAVGAIAVPDLTGALSDATRSLGWIYVAAAVAGDLVSLLLGRRLGRPFLERHGARVGLGAARLARVDGFFERHGGKALFLGRFTGFLRSTMPFVAGSSGVTPRRLLPYSVTSALVWTATFTVLGYAFAESFSGAGDGHARRPRRHPARHHGVHRPFAVDTP